MFASLERSGDASLVHIPRSYAYPQNTLSRVWSALQPCTPSLKSMMTLSQGEVFPEYPPSVVAGDVAASETARSMLGLSLTYALVQRDGEGYPQERRHHLESRLQCSIVDAGFRTHDTRHDRDQQGGVGTFTHECLPREVRSAIFGRQSNLRRQGESLGASLCNNF